MLSPAATVITTGRTRASSPVAESLACRGRPVHVVGDAAGDRRRREVA